MRRRMTIFAVLAAILLLAAAGCGGKKEQAPAGKQESKLQLKIATMTPANHMYSQGAQRFADLIKERTNGRIEITVYPDGQLGKGERELLEALQQGTVDLYVGSTGPVGGFSPSMLIVDIPFLFRDYNHVDKVLDGPIGRQLLDDLEKANLKGLAFWENGFRNLTNSKKPVKTPGDASGLKIRTMENKVHITAWKEVGVIATPMAWAEVYGALQQKVVDGQENPVAVVHSSKLYEVQKYLSMTQHVYSPAPIIMSLKKWQALSKEDQDLFMKTALEVAPWQRKLGRDNEQKMLAELEQKGMVVIKDIDKAAWQKAMQPAFDEFSKQFGKEKIDAILNTK
ncbi:MAG: TRAP transporter substrate-binding protein [Peptococcaceae bacterium]|nr:TRAP transporter substrate-binding protein [Peptococcaceae bacterium]